MPTRPSQGGSNGTWGSELNAWLDVHANSDGTLKTSAVQTALGGSITAFGGASIMAVGDSITANGWSGSAPGLSTDTRAWLMWACLYSKGQLTLTAPTGSGPAAATGGYTTSDILTTEIPIVTGATYKPTLCAVVAGANDIATSVPLATTIANFKAIFAALTAVGILPVVCTMPPRGGTEGAPPASVTQINTFLKRYARLHAYPLVDLFQAVVDTTTDGRYLSAYEQVSPTGHPNGAGAKLMGQTFANTLSKYLEPWGQAPLAGFNLKVSGDTIDVLGTATQNSLMLLDTNVDGVPDGWTLSGASATGNIASPASLGNYYTSIRASADTASRTTTAMSSAAVGDRLLFVAELASSVEGVSGAADCYVTDNAFGVKYAGFTGWDKDIPAGSVLAQEFTWTGSGNLQPRVAVDAVTASGAQIGIARAALYNLTQGGAL